MGASGWGQTGGMEGQGESPWRGREPVTRGPGKGRVPWGSGAQTAGSRSGPAAVPTQAWAMEQGVHHDHWCRLMLIGPASNVPNCLGLQGLCAPWGEAV